MIENPFPISNGEPAKPAQESSTATLQSAHGRKPTRKAAPSRQPQSILSFDARSEILPAVTPLCSFDVPPAGLFTHPPIPAPRLPRAPRAPHRHRATSPFILTVGELGPADCFLHPLQFWQRLSASEMKEQRESSSKRSESSNENLSPSSHSANMSSITSDERRVEGEEKEERRGRRCSLSAGGWTRGAPATLKILIATRSRRGKQGQRGAGNQLRESS